MKISGKEKSLLKTALIIIALLYFGTAKSQGEYTITGAIVDENNQPVIYANVTMLNSSDLLIIAGTISDENGKFEITSTKLGTYHISASFIGYLSAKKSVEVQMYQSIDLGEIILHSNTVELNETVVVGERIKAKSEADKTTYLVSKKFYDASNTGTDILKHIPGVQVDLMQDISLEGSKDILILVDGKERDKNYLGQLNAQQIDKVEITGTPGSKYDANITGVININLKKERSSGYSGHIYTEIPVSKSEVYSFPTYSLNFNTDKLNLFTSYNGEFSYFDIQQNQKREFTDNTATTNIISNQYLKQKNWSHRFHYGFDYFLNDNNQFNFYAFYNAYSAEHDGVIDMLANGVNEEYWMLQKDDNDINYSAFYSLYYQHLFNKKDRELTMDLSFYNRTAEHTTSYFSEAVENKSFNQINTLKPKQNEVSIKIDYKSSLNKKLFFNTGVKVKLQVMKDKYSKEFKYNENIFAAYGDLNYSSSKLDLSLGLRTEKSMFDLNKSFSNNIVALLPHATMNYKFSSKENIKLIFRRSIFRPHFYHLNPYISMDDPYSLSSGNPNLKSEFRDNLVLDYALRFGNNFISTRLFYHKASEAINALTFINEDGFFETKTYNLGNIHQYGIQLSGSLKLHKSITLNPYLKIFNQYTEGNTIAEQYTIRNRNEVAFESGFSAMVSLKKDLSASIQFQYSSPRNEIQKTTFSDALYFISLDKTFNQKFKVGIASGLPFAKSFMYQGEEIEGTNFYSRSEGNIKMSTIPVWLKFNYQFSSGKKGNNIDRVKDINENLPKKGF